MSAPPQSPFPNQPPQPGVPASAPAKSGVPVWAWLLIGAMALVLLVGVAGSVFAYFLAQKVLKNPGAAIAQIAAAANPDLEVLEVNDQTGKLTVRDNKSGKTLTIDADSIKDGRITIDTNEGHAEIGAGANVKVPGWIHLPADVKIVGGLSGDSEKGAGGSVVFHTGESLDQLKSFFESKYKDAGFVQSTSSVTKDDGAKALQLVFTKESRNRTITITAARTGNGSSGTVVYAEKE